MLSFVFFRIVSKVTGIFFFFFLHVSSFLVDCFAALTNQLSQTWHEIYILFCSSHFLHMRCVIIKYILEHWDNFGLHISAFI